MAVRVGVSRPVLDWALEHSATDPADLAAQFNLDAWREGTARPTFKQLESFARKAGLPFGYLLLEEPPALRLPIPDFRAGFGRGLQEPSANLYAVLHQSIQRQEWFREYAAANGLPKVEVVSRAAEWSPDAAAADMRVALAFELPLRRGSRSDVRRHLMRAFEKLGGLCVITSVVGNSSSRSLDADEFRGFALVDDAAPLVFVNAAQTLNGQIFTLAHELAHVWFGQSGISDEDNRIQPHSEVERRCNAAASAFLVPSEDLRSQASSVGPLELTATLDRLADRYRCGTLVVLLALEREGMLADVDMDAAYEQEVRRLQTLTQPATGQGGDFHNNQRYRAGERLSRALIRDTQEGRTSFSEAMHLLNLSSPASFDNYAERLGV
ncbi:ImmA/IrrE family metallo-endopeptidase [Arthrobacter sp. UM1]|uniref:ImmA/IrrE family metallo-endopeptidase n=1 Tax=Arthrobacter sp. UM1 TaxID=2766776 RepID=UPI001CF67679|nr:ImmA/IrrE family metallo-endopeptidase [Arthrobacter sp. UM1]MCB4209223.1 ImmA/IrrE family metallo-endopeptidase [Arthrobacter sp. UM1]